jgi:membrane-associated protease RseP (regulator of RpoE activity)
MKFRLAAVLAVMIAGRSTADGVAIVLELEGTLADNRGQFVLMVENEGSWVLDLNGFDRETARKSPGARVRVTGSAQVRTAGNQLILADRVVHVNLFAVGRPGGLKVTKVVPGSPAENKLAVNDIITEINGKSVASKEKLVEMVGSLRGKPITVVIIRDGISKTVEGITLRTADTPLGVYTEPVLSWGLGGMAMPTDPGPARPIK